MSRFITICLFLSTAILASGATTRAQTPPDTKKTPVTDTYHGTKVSEDYRWLEDWSDPEVRQWSEAQNRYARHILDNLPNVEAIRARVTEILAAKTVSYGSVTLAGGRVFAIKREPPKQQPFLIVMPSVEAPEAARIVLDPNAIDSEGTTAIDWYVPSPDGTLVAVSLSKGGTESGDVHVYETASGREVHEVIPRVNGGTAGGDLAWVPDGSGFYYTRYPRGTERPPEDRDFYQQLYYHQLGTPTSSDRYEIGKDFPRIAEIQLEIDRRTGRLLATVQKGDGGEFAHFLRGQDGSWRQFSRFGDKTVQAAFGRGNELFVVSRTDAPRGKILRVPIETLDVAEATPVIPEGRDAIVTSFMGSPTVLVTDNRIYVVYQLGGPSEIRAFDHEGKPQRAPNHLPVSSVGGLTQLARDDILFLHSSFIYSPTWYSFHAILGGTRKTPLATKYPVDFTDTKVVREFAVSTGKTRVPVNVILPRAAKLDGSNPCIVTGYGGFGVSVTPRFSALRRVLLEQGVIYAVANLRGGGEFGEAWHRQGNLTNKQNVFDDFAAVTQRLIDLNYTTPDRVAVIGGSNGGLLMGAAMVQHPDLMKAVVSYVGIYDMLRVELSPNGTFNIPEFGTVKDPDQFKALYAYSPYHHVKNGTEYPATLFLTGANDPRVDPMQSRKMTARLQEANAANTPILLRTSSSTGHGGDTALSEQIEESVDVYAFLFHQLGVKYQPVKSSIMED